MHDLLFWLVIALIGLTLSSVFSGVETGVYCVNRLRLAVRAGATPPDLRALRLQREVDHPERLIATLLIGNNAANYAGSLGLTGLLVMSEMQEWAVIVINAAVLTPALFVIGETIPKDLFREEADRLTPRFAFGLMLVRWLVTITLLLPIVLLAVNVIQRLIGGPQLEAIRNRQRLGALLKEGASDGVLSAEQTSLIDRALVIGELPITGAMRPWNRIHRIGADWKGDRMIDAAIRADQAGQARLPVVDRRGMVVGLVRTVEVGLADDGASAASIATKALTIDAGDTVRHALRILAEREASCAVVTADGQPVGLATYDGLLAPLLGVQPRG